MKVSRLLFLFISAATLNQCGTEPAAPQKEIAALMLDSISIDERLHELHLFGEFDSVAEMVVLCDSVTLPILTRDKFLIRVAIPDSGKGSCGWVSVLSGTRESDQKLITYWSVFNYHRFWHLYSDGGQEELEDHDTVFLRGDYLSSKSMGRILRVVPITISRYFEYAEGNDGRHGFKYMGPRYKRYGVVLDTFEINSKGINDTHVNRFLEFDTSNEIKRSVDDPMCGSTGYGNCTRWGPLAPTRFPVISE
jgi:hypothetical protein